MNPLSRFFRKNKGGHIAFSKFPIEKKKFFFKERHKFFFAFGEEQGEMYYSISPDVPFVCPGGVFCVKIPVLRSGVFFSQKGQPVGRNFALEFFIFQIKKFIWFTVISRIGGSKKKPSISLYLSDFSFNC